MTKFFFRWLINAVALYAAVWIVPGIDYLRRVLGIHNAPSQTTPAAPESEE